jgi:hypothetical protein
LVAAVVPGELKNTGSHSPHGHAEDEPADSEQGVVHTDLLSALVTTTAISDKDKDADSER